ncbi:MAG: CRISPR-associated endonuclease Cas1 [Oscillospiraceae bacterium]|nr:CRISPR-associated endonuclease Cas1 [Oscillospiraceae bacterium]
MKKLKNVLYVTSPGCTLSVKNRSICVTTDEGSQTVPVHNLESVVCFGDMKVSTPFMQFCSNNGVKLVFLSCYGRYYGTFNGLQTGSVFLRREQYKRFDDPDIRMNIAGDIISAKIRNSVRVLMKNTHSNNRVKTVIEEMMELHDRIKFVSDIDALRGIEGAAAEKYFSVFDEMIDADDDCMKFVRRSRRPVENNVNALLSYCYTLLKTDITAAAESVGLDIQVGVMHTLDYGKPSLVLDMMEEFRAPLCDRFVLSLINRKQVTKDDFTKDDDGNIILSDKCRRTVISEWQTRKKTEVYVEEVNEKIEIGLIPFVQAMMISEYLRNERESYRPFIWR